MEYLSEFYNFLGNTKTTILISFIFGFIFGIIRFGKKSNTMGIIFGLLFAVFASIIGGLINYVLPNNLQFQLALNFDFRSLFTMILVFGILYIVTSIQDFSALTQ